MDASAMPKILYIDDNKSLTKLFFCLGEEYHFQALISNSLTEGLEIAIKEKPDVILIDIHMCDGTGLQYTAKLKTLKETAHIPVIGCSVTYFEDGQKMALLGGFKFVHDKPCTLDKLNKIIEGLLPPFHA